MHSKFILLLLATLQVSYSFQWERPHIRYYSRWAKDRQPDSYEDQPSGSKYHDSHHQPLNHGCHCCAHHSDDVKPVHEDQHEDVPSGSDSFLRDEENHINEDSVDSQSGPGHVYLHGRPRRNDCEIFVNPIHPPCQTPIDKPRPQPDECEIFVNPIRPPYQGPVDKLQHRPDGCEIFVNPIRPPYQVPIDKPRHMPDECEIFVNPIRPPYQVPIDTPLHKPDGCEIFVNSLRPPYQGPINRLPVDGFSEHSGIERPPLELAAQAVPGDEYQSNAASHPGAVINSQVGSCVSGGLTSQDVQASISNSAINEQIRSAALRVGVSPGNELIPAFRPIGLTPLLPFLPSGVEFPINQPIVGPSPPLFVAPALPLPDLPAPNFCIRHRLVPVPVRVVEDCIRSVPVVRKTVRHQVETVTRHVPVTEKAVTQQHEKIVRHVPVAGKTLRNVVETRVRHIPVIKSRTRTVVEPYTVHIPVTIRFTRPVEESITKTVPLHELRTRPVVTQRTRLVPVVERRIRPIVEQRIHHVPVKKQYLRTVVEQRVRPVVGPCQPCILASQPIGLPLSLIPAQDIPRILLSPYSDFSGASGGIINSQPGSINSQLGAAFSGGPLSSGNIVLPGGPVNGQIYASGDHSLAINSQLGVVISGGVCNSGNILQGPINGKMAASSRNHSGIPYGQPSDSSLSRNVEVTGEIGIPPIAHPIIPNPHDTGYLPPASC